MIYTTGTRRADNWDAGWWAWKNARVAERPRTDGTDLDGNIIVAEIAPGPRGVDAHR